MTKLCIDCHEPIDKTSERCRACAAKGNGKGASARNRQRISHLFPPSTRVTTDYNPYCEDGEPHHWILPEQGVRADGHCDRCTAVYPYTRIQDSFESVVLPQAMTLSHAPKDYGIGYGTVEHEVIW
mgnify:FL=1